MGIFGGEKYSKETYEDVTDKAVSTDNALRVRGTAAQEVYDSLAERAVEASKRLEKLHGKGQVEGIALNEEYDRLLAKAMEATKALEDFEKEKLGMSKED